MLIFIIAPNIFTPFYFLGAIIPDVIKNSNILSDNLKQYFALAIIGAMYGYGINLINSRILEKTIKIKVNNVNFISIIGGILSTIICIGFLWNHHIREYFEAIRIGLIFGFINGTFQFLIYHKLFRRSILLIFTYSISYFLISDIWFKGKYIVFILDFIIIFILSGILLGSSLMYISKYPKYNV